MSALVGEYGDESLDIKKATNKAKASILLCVKFNDHSENAGVITLGRVFGAKTSSFSGFCVHDLQTSQHRNRK